MSSFGDNARKTTRMSYLGGFEEHGVTKIAKRDDGSTDEKNGASDVIGKFSRNSDAGFGLRILHKDEVKKLMDDTVEELRQIIEIPEKCARVILSQAKFDDSELYISFYDMDSDKFFKKFNIVNPSVIGAENSGEIPRDCGICFETFLSSEMTDLGCGHFFCNSCWNYYLEVNIINQGKSTITCPSTACPILIDDLTCVSLIKNPRAIEIYKNLVLNNFVEIQSHLVRCSGSNCNNVLNFKMCPQDLITCTCGAVTCRSCGQNDHLFLECDMYKHWLMNTLRMLDEDSKSMQWMSQNTKDCPKCKATLWKVTGCQHVICPQRTCRYEFCWVCLSDWKKHEGADSFEHHYSEEAVKYKSPRRLDIELVTLYHSMYMSNMKSLESEQQLHLKLKEKAEKFKKMGHSHAKVSCFQEGVQALTNSRQIIMHTYIFCSCLRVNNQVTIFLENQKYLQQSIEKLSECLDFDVEKCDFNIIRNNVLHLSAYCELQSKILKDHIQEGYDNNFWEYNYK